MQLGVIIIAGTSGTVQPLEQDTFGRFVVKRIKKAEDKQASGCLSGSSEEHTFLLFAVPGGVFYSDDADIPLNLLHSFAFDFQFHVSALSRLTDLPHRLQHKSEGPGVIILHQVLTEEVRLLKLASAEASSKFLSSE